MVHLWLSPSDLRRLLEVGHDASSVASPLLSLHLAPVPYHPSLVVLSSEVVQDAVCAEVQATLEQVSMAQKVVQKLVLESPLLPQRLPLLPTE